MVTAHDGSTVTKTLERAAVAFQALNTLLS
jgi:hypothetical protein